MADLRVRRAHPPWFEPAMPATWKERFAEIAKEPRRVLWSIESDGRLVGLAVGRVWDSGVGLEVRQLVIDPSEWRRGYGADAALALHRYAFDYLDLRRTDLVLHADNVAALRIAERFGELTPEKQEKRFKDTADGQTQIQWTIAYEGEPVGFTGIFHIDWVRRDGETGLFIGRHDLYGRGIASEAVRLRTGFAWRELRLRRVHNWVALANRGSRRANEKVGYRRMGLLPRSDFRPGGGDDGWLGGGLSETLPPDGVTGRLDVPPRGGGGERQHAGE